MHNLTNRSELSRKDFQTTIDGKSTDLYILTNREGLEMAVCNYGAAILSLFTPDREGRYANIIQGHDSLEHLMHSPVEVLSTTIGRYGNRIAGGRFTLEGQEYRLAINNGPNSLHGGPTGFHRRVWDVLEADESHISMYYMSRDGEEGFQKMKAMTKKMREEAPDKWNGSPIIVKNDYLNSVSTDKDGNKTKIELPVSDVMKFMTESGISVVVRPSGTEPKLKIYFSIRADNKEKAAQEEKALKAEVEAFLGI